MKDPHETCLEIENHLPLWAGGDLEPDVHSSVESHLSRCEGCSRAAVLARSARGALERGLRDEAERMGVGRDPWPAIRASLRAEGLVDTLETAESAPLERPVLRPRIWAWSVAAAVLVGLFLAGTWLPSGGDRGSDATTIVGTMNPSKTRNPRPRDSGGTLSTPVGGSSSDSPLVAIPAGLKRLAPGEPRMRDSAWLFHTHASPDAVALEGAPSPTAPDIRDPREGAAVSLERVQLLPRR